MNINPKNTDFVRDKFSEKKEIFRADIFMKNAKKNTVVLTLALPTVVKQIIYIYIYYTYCTTQEQE